MFKRHTLFVVGAGASVEVGLPLGKRLASIIMGKMDIRFEGFNQQIGTGDTDLFVQLTRQLQTDVREFQEAAWLIRDGIGLAQSIDDFLDLHRTNEYVNLYGKAAIIKTILEFERRSSLYFGGVAKNEVFNPDKVTNTWLVKFLYMLGRDVPREDLIRIFERVSFIVFNYDRCIEHFLLHALQKLYAIQENEASDILKQLRIVHPYGKVADYAPFGTGRTDFRSLAGGIKTYTEQMDDSAMVDRLQNEIDRAQQIVFLGFAYHDQNMALIRPSDLTMSTKSVFGTAFGMSRSDVEVTARQIASWYADLNMRSLGKAPIDIDSNLKCADLFDHFTRSLTAGD
jgi:hypothetical protein